MENPRSWDIRIIDSKEIERGLSRERQGNRLPVLLQS